jgi:hypothetical protein
MPAKGTHHPITATDRTRERITDVAAQVAEAEAVLATAEEAVKRAKEARDTVLRDESKAGVQVRDLVRILAEAGNPVGRQHVSRIVHELPRWTPKKQDA